jgi:2-phosphosulfolactate phosphatase
VSIFDQSGYRVRLEWGLRGGEAAAERGDVLVVVDVLRFSTTVVAAVGRGAYIYPCPEASDPEHLASQVSAELAVPDRNVPEEGRYSLSPHTFVEAEPGTSIVLPSANGSVCAACADSVPALFAGALVNATATAGAVEAGAKLRGCYVTVLACGERWPDDSLRFAIEDYLGAGAILSHLSLPKSPEAQVCEAAFVGCRDPFAEVIWDCGSGRELRERGLEEDVRFAARLDVMDVVAMLRSGRFERWGEV